MFALINRDLTDTGKRAGNVTIVPPGDLHPDKPYWVPIVEDVTDTSTGPDKVVSPWVETVEIARLLRTRTVRDKTSAELGAEDAARIDRLLLDSGVMRALAKALFLVVNDVRTLKGEGTITAAQFKTFLKGLVR